ncbi:hypothetical protein HJFPF1_00324 [Paramyrothecium foliicola]|nr:hypothetical protein HJFPF1_00324 [Paramyrothecium foliicola]
MANLFSKDSHGMVGSTNAMSGNSNNYPTGASRQQGGLETLAGSSTSNRANNTMAGENLTGGMNASNTQSSGFDSRQSRNGGMHAGHGLNVTGENASGNIAAGGQQMRANDLRNQNTVLGDTGGHSAQTSNLRAGENLSTGNNLNTGENLAGGRRSGSIQDNLVGQDMITLAGGPPPSNDLNSRGSIGGSGMTGSGAQQPRVGSIGGTTTTTASGRQTLHGNLDPRDAPTNSVDVGPPDVTQHPPSVFTQHAGEPRIEHDYPEDSTVRRHSVSHQEKHILG